VGDTINSWLLSPYHRRGNMTLRVTFEIVPFGEEDNKRKIREINISNLGPANKDLLRSDVCEYGVEIDKYKTDDYDYRVVHNRNDGDISLVNLVLKEVV
jgi:hypothetical protein